LAADVAVATELARAGERARTLLMSSTGIRNTLTVTRLEALYEVSYVKLFTHWEKFLEDSFLRHLCGFVSSHGPSTLVAGAFDKTLADAHVRVAGGQPFLLWHNVQKVVARGQKYFVAGRHETVLQSHLARLEWFSAVRHRIAHLHDDARVKFDTATMGLAARRVPASRAGTFLRQWAPHLIPSSRWLDVIASELIAVGQQVA
jgi:hypothetical protein